MKTLRRLVPLILALSFAGSAYAQQFNVEARGEYESWSSGLGGQSTALLGGLGLGYYKDKYFVGGGFVTGNYAIEGQSADDLSRTDLDLVAGYRLKEKISVFAGYRLNKMSLDSDKGKAFSFDDTTHGIGGGASIYEVLPNKFIAFGSAALSLLLSNSDYQDGTSDKGKGFSVNTEAGVLYPINSQLSVAARIKYQTSRLDYNPDSWPHSYLRFGLNLGYSF